MNEQEATDLLYRYRQGNTTEAENQLLYHWYAHELDLSGQPDFSINDEAVRQEIWKRIKPEPVIRKVPVYRRYAAAAIVALAIAATATIYYQYYKPQTHQVLSAQNIQPGGNKATLTLANGKEISLTTQSGLLAATYGSGMLVSNNASTGVVTFKSDSKTGGEKRTGDDTASLNTITTPNGGQYQLVLSDGTSVFLNAGSKITFPSRFAGTNRTVSISGEAYFQVAKDRNHPFIVNTETQRLTVLGTHFNISAYTNEPVKTTLAEGSVQLSSKFSLKTTLLKPQQQAVLMPDGFAVHDVSLSTELAWTKSIFRFSGIPLKDAMKQISRWYDVPVDYDSLPDETIFADIDRRLTLGQALQAVEFSGFKFEFTPERRLKFIK